MNLSTILPFRRRDKDEPEAVPDVAVNITDDDGRLRAYAAHRHLIATGPTARSHRPDKANDGIWAHYLLAPVNWPHTSAEHRTRVIDTFAHALADLAGHRVKLRITDNPFNVKGWVDDLNARTEHTRPADSDDAEARTFTDFHERAQRYIHSLGFSKSVTVLSVRITSKKPRDKAELALLFSKEPLTENRALWEKHRRRLDEIDAVMARIGGVPMQRNWMGWLIYGSIGMGLPVPTGLLQSTEHGFDPDQIAGFTNAVYPVARRMGSTTVLHSMRGGEQTETHVAVLHAQDIRDRTLEEVAAGQIVPLLLYPRRFNFPVDVLAVFDVIEPGKLLRNAEVTRRTADDLGEHYAEHGERASILQRVGVEQAERYEDEVTKAPKHIATRANGVVMFAVSGPNEDFVRHERVQPLIAEFSREARTELVHNYGQYASYRAFIPGESVNMTGYTSQMSVRTLASMVPHGDMSAGDKTGVPFGPVSGGSDLMLFDFWGGARRNKSNMILLFSDQGGGKSTTLGVMADGSASIFGAQTTATDPSGALAAITRTKHMKGIARHIDLTSARPGTMATSIMVPDPNRDDFESDEDHQLALEEVRQDRRELALDSLSMLLPPRLLSSDQGAHAEATLGRAIREAGGEYGVSPWEIVARLEAYNTDISRLMVEEFITKSEQRGGRQLFPERHRDLDPDKVTALLDNNLSVLTMPGIEPPSMGAQLHELNSSERASRLLLFLSARLSMRTMYANKKPKMILADELAMSAAGESAYKSFLNRGSVDSRKWNSALVLAAQNPIHLTSISPQITNLAGMVIAGRHGSEEAALAGIGILGIPAHMGYHHELMMLEPGELVIRDWSGRHRTVALDLGHVHPHLVSALDTSPNKEVVAAHSDLFEGVPASW